MSDQISASHILVSYSGAGGAGATRSKEEALTQIEALKEEVDGGADFADLAKQHSDCPSGQGGGDLGSFRRGAMVPAFEEAAFGLDAGDTSDVVETDFGFHLIQRTG